MDTVSDINPNLPNQTELPVFHLDIFHRSICVSHRILKLLIISLMDYSAEFMDVNFWMDLKH